MTAMNNKRVAVIGAGNIGKMLLERMRVTGIPGNLLFVCDSDPVRAKSIAAQVGASFFNLADPSTCTADIWLLCPGPKAVLPVLQQLSPQLKPGQIVVSFAAAVSLTKLDVMVPNGVSLARVMPNMPSLVGQGMNPVCFSGKATSEARKIVLELLDALGKTIEIRDDQMNWCVGLSGAAMRSVLPIIEGMFLAGTEAGLSEANTRLIASQVILGTAELVKNTSLSLAEIKKLTPMETLDEGLVARLFYEAARGAKEKIDRLEEKIAAE